ncbi:hypothetical protein CH254_11320 [Rhodococcus sp. 06-412-2C]|uniref:hypothetical protein n=1 Tax=unclassified Rhodococcus (in: high G+C Gram-positive bacteria) TaxID=192944 RepID=UPI000B9B6671|nr:MULTISPECIES: hypothetical protein [unclassified Rhodococcus (in: high G+C Gram-positive bacteria)]OZC88503.1 hypothetical protein CH254_11320 [Rhodococcus sp. 06-412-2C]
MNDFHAHELVDFAVRWIPYGGAGDEEIWVAFGLNPAGYRRRLHAALQCTPDTVLDEATRAHLQLQIQLRTSTPRPLVGQ